MKSLFFASAITVLAFTSFEMSAHSSSSSSSEVCQKLAYFTAKDTSPFFIGSDDIQDTPMLQFAAIPFTQQLHFNGKGIRPISPTQVELKKGHYLVSYSGSSEILDQSGSTFCEIDYAIFLDAAQYFDFPDSSERDFDRFRLTSFTTTVQVKKKSVLTIQASIVTPPTGAASIKQRSLVITRLE